VLEFSVLGPLRVTRNGEELPPMRPKCRALLGLLLARANHAVSTGQLIDELWMHNPPEACASAFRVHLAALRKTLGASAEKGELIEPTQGGYRLAVIPESVDAVAFEAAIAQARSLWSAGAARETAAELERAMAMRRGTAYASLRDIEPLRDEGVRLDEIWLGAVELLCDAYLELGRPRDVCDLLPPIIAANPLREGLTERVMLALYREGRQHDAMRAFARLREALDEELGFEPSASVRALEEAIILQDADLDPMPHADPRDRMELPESDVFVGRRRELETLERVWNEVRERGPRLVLIGGPAGIGKSTLVDQIARRGAERGASVVIGRCEPDPVSDYEPLPQLVRALVELASPELLERPLLGELARLVPDLAERLPAVREPADASAGRLRLFAAVDELLAGVCARGPLVVVAEDLHWSGPDALALLRHLVSNASGAVMVVATYRDDELDADSALADALSSDRLPRRDVVQLRLVGLEATELQALVQATAPDDLRQRALARLAELRDVTMGNPFYAREVLRELADATEPLTIAEVAPDGARSIVARRLVRVGAATRTLLGAAAVIGREFSLDLLMRMTGMDEAETLDAVEDALLAQLFAEGSVLDDFTFSHPLYRNAIYTDMPAARRARLHLDAAAAIEALATRERPARAAELARHYLAARPRGDAARAADYSTRAGEEAAAAFAHAEAATWYRRAIDLAVDAGWDARRLAATFLALGESLERAGQRDEAREAFLEAAAQAKVADDGQLIVDVAIAATPRYVALDAFHERLSKLVDDALSMPVSDPRRRAWLLSSAGASHYYEGDRGDEEYMQQAMELARESSDPEVQAASLLTRRRWLTHDAVLAPERLAASRVFMTLCREQRLDGLIGTACRNLLVDLMEMGELAEFDMRLEEFAELADAHGLPADIYWLNALRATRALMRAPDAYTEELIMAARTLGASLQQWDAGGTFVLQMFALRYQQHRVHEVRKGLQQPQPQFPRVVAGVAILAAALVACDRDDAARVIVDQVLEGGELRLPHDNLWLGAVALMSGTVAVVGTPEQRALIARELQPFAERWCIFGAGGAAFGTGHHWLGRIARAQDEHEGAARHFEAAARLSDRAGATYWAQLARSDLATVRSPA